MSGTSHAMYWRWKTVLTSTHVAKISKTPGYRRSRPARWPRTRDPSPGARQMPGQGRPDPAACRWKAPARGCLDPTYRPAVQLQNSAANTEQDGRIADRQRRGQWVGRHRSRRWRREGEVPSDLSGQRVHGVEPSRPACGVQPERRTDDSGGSQGNDDAVRPDHRRPPGEVRDSY
jgi:hypothetical protein